MNDYEIFEGVHRSYKFVVLSFQKGTTTNVFPAAFMRLDVDELDRFPQEGAIGISVDLVRRLSPDSLSIMEFRSPVDVAVAGKMLKWPALGQTIEGTWTCEFTREVNNMADMKYVREQQDKEYSPLYEGKIIHQFQHDFERPRYFIHVSRFNRENSRQWQGQYPSDFFRLCFRRQARGTDSVTFIGTVAPTGSLFFDNLGYVKPFDDVRDRRLISDSETLFLLSCLNSFSLQWMLRQQINANLSFYFLYQLPVPRLTDKDAAFWLIVHRAARLICTTPAFDSLAKAVGLKSCRDGTTDPDERAVLRAELDGLIAHLYGLTEEEFAYILTTFPLVEQRVKDAALAAYREFTPKSTDEKIADVLAGGESATVEFKSSARWDMRENRPNKTLEQVIVKTVAAFLNTEGGTLCIGVDDSGKPVGLAYDYKTLGKKQDRDGYENWLTTLLLSAFGKEKSTCIQLAFHSLEGKEVCVVNAKPFPSPIYVKEDNAENLYIRAGNSTRLLTSREAVEYVKQHWA